MPKLVFWALLEKFTTQGDVYLVTP